MTRPLRIGNAQGFWGDSPGAPRRLLEQAPELDFLTLDYLAELSLSIMASQRERDPSAGYARDFLEVIDSLVPYWQSGGQCRIVTNAGGLNPEGCASACAAALGRAGLNHLRVFSVSGDDVLEQLRAAPEAQEFRHLETKEPLGALAGRLVAANAYLGAQSVAEAIAEGAHVVVTGRVADPSLTVAPCVAHFNWSWTDYSRLAAATVAGHLIECGTQATGGFSTDWLDLPDHDRIGYPIVEVEEDGSFVITKPPASGGRVTLQTVKEQLLYEIGDPGAYLSPDATVSLLGIALEQQGENQVRVTGARGGPPPERLKVSASYRDGYKAHATLTVFGRDAVRKAQAAGEGVFRRLREAGCKLERTLVETIGGGACAPGVDLGDSAPLEVVLRLSAADSRKEALERFSKEIAPLVTCGPQGVAGYASGRAKPVPVFAYWPCLIQRGAVRAKVVEVAA
jgi:hypothetical protein